MPDSTDKSYSSENSEQKNEIDRNLSKFDFELLLEEIKLRNEALKKIYDFFEDQKSSDKDHTRIVISR